MNIIGRKVIYAVATALVVCLAYGCSQQDAGKKSDDLASLEELGPTIGSLVRVTSPGTIKVEGYGLVIPVAKAEGRPAEGDGRNSPQFMRDYRTGGTPWTILVDPEGVVRFDGFSIEPEQAIAAIERMLPKKAEAAGDGERSGK